jgi:hypothetical protein
MTMTQIYPKVVRDQIETAMGHAIGHMQTRRTLVALDDDFLVETGVGLFGELQVRRGRERDPAAQRGATVGCEKGHKE